MVALILFNKSAHGDKYSKIICSRFLPAKFDFRLACDVGLRERSGSVHLRHVAETSAAELPTSACVPRFWAADVRSLFTRYKCHKKQKEARTFAPEGAPIAHVCTTASLTFIHFVSAELSSGLEIVPGPWRPATSEPAADESLLGARGKKCFPYVSTSPRRPSSFREMM